MKLKAGYIHLLDIPFSYRLGSWEWSFEEGAVNPLVEMPDHVQRDHVIEACCTEDALTPTQAQDTKLRTKKASMKGRKWVKQTWLFLFHP